MGTVKRSNENIEDDDDKKPWWKRGLSPNIGDPLDEKQLKLLYNDYGNKKGFKDYNEFKSLMQVRHNRKMFFDESNKDLGFKDFNEFENLLGDSKGLGAIAAPIENKNTGKPKRYQVGNDFYEIPGHEVQSFLKDNPGAKEVKLYNVNGEEYNIPVDQAFAFEKEMGLPASEEKKQLVNYIQGLKTPTKKEEYAAAIGKQKAVNQLPKPKKNNNFLQPVTEELDEEARNTISGIMYGDGHGWKDPLKELRKRSYNTTNTKERTILNHAIDISLHSLAPDGWEANRVLQTSLLGHADLDNETATALKAKAADYEKKTEELRNFPLQDMEGANDLWHRHNSLPALRSAAVNWFAKQNKAFGAQLNASSLDTNDYALDDKMPSSKLGAIVNEYLRSPEVHTFLEKENPGLLPAFQFASRNLLSTHLDFGKNVVANEVSREIQRSGYNRIEPIFNFADKNMKEYADLTAQSLYRNDPQKLKIWNDYIKNNQEDYLDTPSFFEGFANAGKDFLKGIGDTFTEPFSSTSHTIKRKWDEEASHVSANPKGLVKFMHDIGHAAGLVSTIGATSNLIGAAGISNPQTAGAIATATGFLGDQLEEGKMKYPDSPVKAWTSAIVNTALYSALSYDLFPAAHAKAALQNIKPGLTEVVENLTSGAITRQAAKREITGQLRKAIDFSRTALNKNLKVSAEMTAIAATNRTLDKLMGMDPQTFDFYHPEDEEADTFKSMFISNSLIAGLAASGQIKTRNRVAEESIYEAASNPKRFERVIDEVALLNPELNKQELLGNLQHAVKVKSELEGAGISDPVIQKRYLMASLIGKVAEEKKKASPDPVLQKEHQEVINSSNSLREKLLSESPEIPESSKNKVKTSSAGVPFDDGSKGLEQASSGGSGTTSRISIAPIAGEKPKNLSDILHDVSKGLKQKLFFIKPDARRAAGTYSPGSTAVKLRYSGDLDTAIHEIGHAMDDKYSFVKQADPIVLKELKQFSPYGSKPPKGHPDPRGYEMAEGLAEFLRAYAVNPEETKRTAPKTVELYEKLLPENVRKVIDEFSYNVRVLAGATGRDVILSNIELEPQKESTVQKILAEFKKDDEFSISFADRLAANMLDPLRPFQKAFDYAKGMKSVDEVLPENDPIILARLLAGGEGKYGEMLKTGIVNSRGEVIKDANGAAKNLNWLLEPLKNNTPEGVKEDMADVISYMVAERTVELGEKFERANVLTGVGAGIYSDLTVAMKALDQFNEYPESKKQRIIEAANRYRSFSTHILEYLKDKGRLSQEQYERIIKDNVQYVALNRILESAPNEEIEVYHQKKRSLGSSHTPVHEIKGSTRKIQNPYISLMDSLYKSVREADRNEVLRSFRDMLIGERGMYEGDPENLAEIGVRVKQGESDTIPIFINGKPEFWKFQPDVYKAIKGFDSDGYRLHPLLTVHAKLLRWCVTHWPVFAARNWVRDFQDRLIKSNENIGLSGFTNIWGKREDWKELARSGGLNAGYYVKNRNYYYGLLKEGIKEVSKDSRFTIVDAIDFKKHWQRYENALYSGETSNRVAEYRSAFDKAKKRGFDDYNAALYGASKSRDLLDFAIAGHYAKLINQVIPFTNAALQGLRSSFIRAKENPKAFAIRLALYTVVPQVAMWLLNHRDPETAEQYENLPNYQRDMFFNLKLGPDQWLSIPKPFELSLPSAGIDRLMSYLVGKEDAFSGYDGSVIRGFLPVDESALAGSFSPFVEIMTNYNFFKEKTIVPPHENVLNLALRNTESSSRLGLFLQKYLHVDARKIDHLIKTQFSYFGDVALKLSNVGDDDKLLKFGTGDLGFFKNSPGYNSPVVQEWMKYANEWRLTSTGAYKEFQHIMSTYFDAKEPAEKEKYGAILIETARMLLSEARRVNIPDQRILQHEIRER